MMDSVSCVALLNVGSNSFLFYKNGLNSFNFIIVHVLSNDGLGLLMFIPFFFFAIDWVALSCCINFLVTRD
jgi:hypothetical protein